MNEGQEKSNEVNAVLLQHESEQSNEGNPTIPDKKPKKKITAEKAGNAVGIGIRKGIIGAGKGIAFLVKGSGRGIGWTAKKVYGVSKVPVNFSRGTLKGIAGRQ